MAKKSRRARAKTRTGGSLTQQKNTVQAQVQPQRTKQSISSQPAAMVAAIKANQYDYVVGDLIRIGVIAGGLILVLIVLTFILR